MMYLINTKVYADRKDEGREKKLCSGISMLLKNYHIEAAYIV